MDPMLAQELLIGLTVLLLFVVGLILPVAATVSAALIDHERWEAAGRSKAWWVGVLVAGAALTPIVGTVVGATYWFGVRPRLIQDRRATTA